MNLTWHIVKKDFARLRLPLALWVALMLGQFVLSFQMLRVVEEDAIVLQRTLLTLDALHEILWVLQLFLGFMLVATLIHEDPLVGQQTWWVTRPISGGRLLGAKLIALVLFFWLLPVVVALPWWLYCGYGAGEVIQAAAQIVVGQAAVTILAFAAGVMTADYSRFVVVSLVTFFAWMTSSFTILSSYSARTSAGMWQTRGWMATAIALVALGIIIIHQFRTRRTWRSWAVLATGFCLMLLILRYGPWDWSDSSLWRAGEPPGLADVTVSSGQVEFNSTLNGPKDDDSLLGAYIGVRFEHTPTGIAFTRGKFSSTLRWPDGMQTVRTGRLDAFMGPEAWRRMGLKIPAAWARFPDLKREPGALVAATNLPRSLAAKLREQAPVWDARLEVGVYQGEIVATVPLKSDAAGGRSGHWVHVLAVEHTKKGGLVLTTAETEPVIELDNLPGFITTGARRGIPNVFFELCSRDRTKFVTIGDERQLYTMTSTVGVMRRTIVFMDGQLANPADPNWLDDAVLVKVAFRRTGTIVRSVHSDALIETEASRKKLSLPVIKSKPAPGT